MKTIPFLPHHFIEIKQHMERGFPIIFPTETCYGFSGDIFSLQAILSVEKIKQRIDNPFLILVEDIKMMGKYGKLENKNLIQELSEEKSTSFILPKTKQIPSFFFPNWKEIGIRIPQYNPLIGFLSFYKKPIFSTSCNITAFPPLYNSNKIKKTFANIPNLLFCDVGDLEINNPSRIIKIERNGEKEGMKILRK